MACPVVVLVSGSGTLLQALLDAEHDGRLDARLVAVGSDRPEAFGLVRAKDAGLPTFVVPMIADRDEWDRRLTQAVAGYRPGLVVSAGFMRLVGPRFLARFGGRCINSHPALLPSFPGMHGVRDALAAGVKVTGTTIFMVDDGVDTGRILAQRAVDVAADDTEETLHERIKVAERALLVRVVNELAQTTEESDD